MTDSMYGTIENDGSVAWISLIWMSKDKKIRLVKHGDSRMSIEELRIDAMGNSYYGPAVDMVSSDKHRIVYRVHPRPDDTTLQ